MLGGFDKCVQVLAERRGERALRLVDERREVAERVELREGLRSFQRAAAGAKLAGGGATVHVSCRYVPGEKMRVKGAPPMPPPRRGSSTAAIPSRPLYRC